MDHQPNPNRDERREIITAAADVFKRRFYTPSLGGLDVDHALSERMRELLDTDAFPGALCDVFAASGARPIDVFHESERKVSLSRFLKATLFEVSVHEYVFRDVFVGGRARRANLQPGDRIISVNGLVPESEDIRVPAHRSLDVVVEPKIGGSKTLSFEAPSSYKPTPEKNVEYQMLDDDIGHIRIASWPGILGIEVARETDIAIRALKCKRLIVDLRGNFGSVGAGNLRTMSYFTPARVPVGYSLTRRRAEEGYDPECLPRFERIPRWKIEAFPVLWKFRKLDKSIVVVTEGLARQVFHGHVVLLVNRHTISGAEIVVQFAKQHGLAVIVGERTAGRSLSFGTFQLPHEFRFTLPVGDYVPWSGSRFEDCGIEPDIASRFWPSAKNETDDELSTAMEVARSEKTLRQYAR